MRALTLERLINGFSDHSLNATDSPGLYRGWIGVLPNAVFLDSGLDAFLKTIFIGPVMNRLRISPHQIKARRHVRVTIEVQSVLEEEESLALFAVSFTLS